jgi:radical SAM protein with 4Fe4S-binding SPASM domain
MITSRIDNITRISSQYLGTTLPAPKSVKLELTATCNYRCNFCTRSLHEDSGDMERGLYSKIIRDLRQAGVEELGLFYIGESFVCKWLPEAIKEAKDVGFPYVFLTTNGSAATPQRVRACMEAGLDSLKFSLNFYSAAQLAEIAKVSPHFWRRAIENLKLARAIRDEGNGNQSFKCGLYASSIAFDGEQGDRMRAVVEEIKPYVDEWYALPLYGMSGASKAAGWKPQPGNPGRLENMRDPLPCWSVFTEGHITKDGLVSACCFGNGATDSLCMGDLKEQPFMQIWNNEKYRDLRQAHLNKDVSKTACAECAAA